MFDDPRRSIVADKRHVVVPAARVVFSPAGIDDVCRFMPALAMALTALLIAQVIAPPAFEILRHITFQTAVLLIVRVIATHRLEYRRVEVLFQGLPISSF